jgi:nitrate reductase delta subunit
MRLLKVISLLLSYPSQELIDDRAELEQVVIEEALLSEEAKQQLLGFIAQLLSRHYMDAQEDYIATFDRGRYTSLLLFEHVHGESRDRGQAMVDMINVYKDHGYELSARELPDFIPLYLEFLSCCDPAMALEWLDEINHILALLEERLIQRDSPYAVLFTVLLSLVTAVDNRSEIVKQVSAEERDDTMEAIDKVWEEEVVRFGADSATGGGCSSPSTIDYSDKVNIEWVDAAANTDHNQPGMGD